MAMRGREHLSHGDRLGEPGLVRLEKRRPRGELVDAYKYLKGGRRGDGAGLLPAVPSDRTRGSGHKPEPRRLRLSVRGRFCAGR